MNLLGNDYEIRRTIWDSKIPIEFILETTQPMRTAQSSFMMLPRISYFPLYIEETLSVLTGNEMSEEDLNNAWLLCNDEMLRWHYPIGVLYDMYNVNNQTLPWLLKIRTKDFPDDLIRCSSKDIMKFIFIQSLKEASQIKHRNNIVSAMTKEEHSRLFDSLCNDKFGDFWSINEKLMASGISEGKDDFLNIPIRFYQQKLPSPFLQLLIPLRHGNKNEYRETTLIEALEKAFPEHNNVERMYDAVSHGIELPANTKISWLARNLTYADNFVHIVLKPK